MPASPPGSWPDRAFRRGGKSGCERSLEYFRLPSVSERDSLVHYRPDKEWCGVSSGPQKENCVSSYNAWFHLVMPIEKHVLNVNQ